MLVIQCNVVGICSKPMFELLWLLWFDFKHPLIRINKLHKTAAKQRDYILRILSGGLTLYWAREENNNNYYEANNSDYHLYSRLKLTVWPHLISIKIHELLWIEVDYDPPGSDKWPLMYDFYAWATIIVNSEKVRSIDIIAWTTRFVHWSKSVRRKTTEAEKCWRRTHRGHTGPVKPGYCELSAVDHHFVQGLPRTLWAFQRLGWDH